MTKQEVKKRIENLKKLINYHRYLYHVFDKQEISDEAFDSLKHELYKLEQQFPEFITSDSPTQRVGGQPLKEFKKAEHKVPMLSLEDVFSEKELLDWQNYLKRLAPSFFVQKEGVEYFCELKVDGFAVELVYENGILKTGSTRGDGLIGEDVTQNLKTIESIPLKLEKSQITNHKLQTISNNQKHKHKRNLKFGLSPKIWWGEEFPPALLEVRGEVYMEKNDFEQLNKKPGNKYSNPRNLAAGSIRQLNPELAASRPLKFLAYGIVTDVGQKKHSQEHQILSLLGFKTDFGKVCKNLSEALNYWQKAVQKRGGLPFQIDGIVISVNENSLFDKLGVAGKSPRGARAFKFSPKQATTRILDIKIQVGRTGAITPIALLEPIEIGGAIISRATLHNEDEIKRLGIKIGDTVIVERAGDVIPSVSKVLFELRTGKEKNFHFPKTCSNCLTKLSKPLEEAVWRCPNQNCPARKRENFYHFVSKKAFNIDGLGSKIIDKLMDENLIFEEPDLFQLREGDLVPLEGFAEKSARNLIEAIERSKKISLTKFIFALGIRHLGEETAIDLAGHFGSIDKLKKASQEELEKIPDIGPKTAESIYNWFQSRKNQKFIDNLLSAGIQITEKAVEARPLPVLRGKTFVLTGELKGMSREGAKEKIRSLGGNISEAVSKKTDYLIAGREPGSKLEKAKKLGVEIINEKEFLNMIK